MSAVFKLASVALFAIGARAFSPRATLVSVDQCATINADLVLPVLSSSFDFGHISECA